MASGHLHDPAALSPGYNLRYQLNRYVDGPQSRYGRFEGEKNFLSPPGFRSPDRPARSKSLYRPTAVYVGGNIEVHLPANDRKRIRASRILGSGTMTAVLTRQLLVTTASRRLVSCCCRIRLRPRQQLNGMGSIRPNGSQKLYNMNKCYRTNPHSALCSICYTCTSLRPGKHCFC